MRQWLSLRREQLRRRLTDGGTEAAKALRCRHSVVDSPAKRKLC